MFAYHSVLQLVQCCFFLLNIRLVYFVETGENCKYFPASNLLVNVTVQYLHSQLQLQGRQFFFLQLHKEENIFDYAI